MTTQHPPFKFSLGQRLALTVSGESGDCISRSESTIAEPQYLIRYRTADGRATEQWWGQSAIEACDGILASAMATPATGDTNTQAPAATEATVNLGGWRPAHPYQDWVANKRLMFLSGDAQPIKAECADRRFYVPHPSRMVPKCTDCTHIDPKYQQNCCHPFQPCHLDDGTSIVRARLARGDAAVCSARGFAHCGEAGALFEPISATPATFAQRWLAGALPLPVTPCTAEQLYRAYRHWLALTGGQWPPDQANFTDAVKRALPQLRYEACRLVTPSTHRTSRVWLPTAEQPGENDIDDFDRALVRWIQSPA